MEGATTASDQEPSNKLECVAKDVDLKAEMEKVKEWVKKNPIPTCKYNLAVHICMNIIFIVTIRITFHSGWAGSEFIRLRIHVSSYFGVGCVVNKFTVQLK